jgi:hypothetical protein
MLPTQLLSVLHKPRCVCVRGTRPSSRARRACPERSRRDGAPPRAGDASEIKSLGPLADVSIFSISLIPMEAEHRGSADLRCRQGFNNNSSLRDIPVTNG